MAENSFKENLKHLKEIILDEERIVTYISICKELCIHVNSAKILLTEVVKALRQDYPDMELNVNYVISGVSDVNRGQVLICSEEELQKIKDTFKVIFFMHVYSISKGSNLFDKVAFTSVNTFEDVSLCIGLIKNNHCFKRTPDELGTLKSNSQEAVASHNSQNLCKPPKDTKPISTIKKELENVNTVKEKVSESLSDKKQEIPSPKKIGIQNATNSMDKKSDSKPLKGITGYFSKANGTSSTKLCKTAKDTTLIEKESIKQKGIEIKIEKDEIKSEETVVKKEGPVNGTKSKKSNNLIKPNARVDKKRKRVLHVSDSESDNEENDPFTEQMAVDNESDDEIPPTPTLNTVKITSGIVNPKKRRKIVDKTYTDEDGYILTKKEEIYESCSDKEEDIAKKEYKTTNKTELKIEVSPKGKNTKAAPKKKISPPQKGKQSTMTSFFKKV